MFVVVRSVLLKVLLAPALAAAGGATELCLDAEFDLGARYQGMRLQSGEFYPATWCMLTDDEHTVRQ